MLLALVAASCVLTIPVTRVSSIHANACTYRSWRFRRSSGPLMKQTLPRNLKEMVDQLRGSVQASLSSRQSRIEVEMPLGFDFGVEEIKRKKSSRGKVIGPDDVSRSDRELARLFVGMFEGTGLSPLVLFATEREAAAAVRKWMPGDYRVQALSGGEETKKKPKAAKGGKGGGGGGFGKPAGGAEGPAALSRVPKSAEVVLVVAPGPKQLAAVRDFCEDVGLDRLVVLLNARLGTSGTIADEAREYYLDEFETAFTFVTEPLRDPTADVDPDADPAVLWRAYPDDWVLARKPKIGPPKQLLSSPERPVRAPLAAPLTARARDSSIVAGPVPTLPTSSFPWPCPSPFRAFGL